MAQDMWTKEKILKRGWTEDAIELIAGKKHGLNYYGKEVWHMQFITNLEKGLSFKNFTTAEDFKQRVLYVDRTLDQASKIGIEHVKGLGDEFEKHDCLIKNKDNYNLLKPVFHLVKKDFAPDDNGSYSLFTDGSFKTMGKQGFASCAGWILDNKTQEIVVEFIKAIEITPENVDNREMPEFELIGISEGVKAIKQLGLKNVQCYTDSSGEAKTILSAIKNIGDKRVTENIDLYEPIIEILKASNSTIGWIPREYNSHADKLAKLSIKAWVEVYKKSHVEKDHIAENGYVIDRQKEIYFHNDKIEFKDSEQLQSQWTVYSLIHHVFNEGKFAVSLIHDRENDSLSLLHSEKPDLSYIDESLPEKIKNMKKTRPDAISLINICKAINMVKDLGDINVCVPEGVIAVCNKLAPIPPNFQEEYYEFHRTYNEFPGKMTITNLDKNMQKKIQNFLQNDYPKLVENQNNNKLKM